MTTKTADFVLRFKNIPPGAEADFKVAFQGADILVVAESHMRIAKAYAPLGWGTVQFFGHVNGRVAIYYRLRRFELLSAANPLLNAANGLDFPGARRLGTAVTLRDALTGRKYNIEGDHFVPHADEPSEPGAIIRTPRGKLAVIPAIQSIVARFPRRRAGQDIVVGDFNIDLDSDLVHHSANDMLERVNAVGLRSDVQILGPVHDTHGTQEYDWILVRFTPGVAHLVSHGTGPKLKSDHRDRWIRVRATVRRGWKVPAGYGR